MRWLLVLFIFCPVAVHGQETKGNAEPERAARLKVMRDLAGDVRVYGPEKKEIPRIEKPLMRPVDASRGYQDGTMWAFGRTGRPDVVMLLQTNDASTGKWWHAATSLTKQTLRVERKEELVWAPSKPGIAFADLKNAQAPAKSKPLRLIQMRKLARRCTAHQFWNPNNQRFQLRLLPQPIHRYSDSKKGITDGAVFGFMVNVHPELLLILESVKQDERESWRFAFAKIGSAEFHAQLDGEEVFKSPRAPRVVGRQNDTYRMFFVSIDP